MATLASPIQEPTTAILLQEKLRAAGADARIFVYAARGVLSAVWAGAMVLGATRGAVFRGGCSCFFFLVVVVSFSK